MKAKEFEEVKDDYYGLLAAGEPFLAENILEDYEFTDEQLEQLEHCKTFTKQFNEALKTKSSIELEQMIDKEFNHE